MADGERGADSRDRILRAARRVLAERGLDATVEEVAATAGMSRRTVFRHFDSRDRLLAAAVRDGIRSYEEHLGPPPETADDLETWLTGVLVTIHRLNAGHGRVYWELTGLGPALAPEIAAAAEERRERRVRLVARFTDAVWRTAGGTDEPPTWLADACAVQLSAFATRALEGDFGREPEAIGRVCAKTLAAAARAAVAERIEA